MFWMFWYVNIKNNFLKNKKNIIDIYFSTKNYLKNNHNHTGKHIFNIFKDKFLVTSLSSSLSLIMPPFISWSK
jgi:hypothetical protein